MKPGDEVWVSRDDLRDAAGAVLERVKRRPTGSLRLAPGEEPGTVRVMSELATRAIAAEGVWRSHVVVHGEWLWMLCQPGKVSPRLRLTFFGDALMVGPTALRVQAAWPDGSTAAQGNLLAPEDKPVKLKGLKRRYQP